MMKRILSILITLPILFEAFIWFAFSDENWVNNDAGSPPKTNYPLLFIAIWKVICCIVFVIKPKWIYLLLAIAPTLLILILAFGSQLF